jgi:hypothetical protein
MQAGLQESVYFINLILSLYYMPNDIVEPWPLPIGIDTLNTKRILRRDSGNESFQIHRALETFLYPLEFLHFRQL